MTEIYYPFDTGLGASTKQDRWMKMAALWRPTGVIPGYANELAVSGDSSGMNVKLATGAAWMMGGYYENDAIKTLAIAAAHATLDRIDRVVIGIDWVNNTILSYVLTGTPGANPVAPALTQTWGVLWEISRALVTVTHTVTTITTGNVTPHLVQSTVTVSDPCGRLTLASGTPVTITDQVDKTTLYYTPFKGNTLQLFNGAGWDTLTFAELYLASSTTPPRSQAYTNDPAAGSNITLNMANTVGFRVRDKVLVSSSAGSEWANITVVTPATSITVDVLALNHTTVNPLVSVGLPYDIWTYNNSGMAALASTAWTDGATRATALALQNGKLVKSGAPTYLYIGTVYVDAAGKYQDTGGARYVWNYYNRTKRDLVAVDPAATWSYVGAWRPANANTTNGQGRCSIVVGVAEVRLELTRYASWASAYATEQSFAGIGWDITNANSVILTCSAQTPGASYLVSKVAYLNIYPAIGFHFAQNTENGVSSGSITWVGSGVPSGSAGSIEG